MRSKQDFPLQKPCRGASEIDFGGAWAESDGSGSMPSRSRNHPRGMRKPTEGKPRPVLTASDWSLYLTVPKPDQRGSSPGPDRGRICIHWKSSATRPDLCPEPLPTELDRTDGEPEPMPCRAVPGGSEARVHRIRFQPERPAGGEAFWPIRLPAVASIACIGTVPSRSTG